MKPEILKIFICSNKGEPMRSIEYVEALTGLGLAGDRYALNKGTCSKDDPIRRQATFIAIEAIEEANSTLEAPFKLKETRRNIVTKNVDLNDLVGKQFQIGLVVFKGIELCDPCNRPSKLAGKEHFQEAFINKGGLRTEIISGGMVTVGEFTLKMID